MSLSKYIWILDNGHGGVVGGHYLTEGKRSPVWSDGSQLFEGEFNRAVVARITEGLTALNVGYMLLAPEQEDISLTARISRAESFYAHSPLPCILISVHANAGSGNGYEIFTSKGQTKSDEYAEIFLQTYAHVFPGYKMRKDITDGDLDKEANFAILHKTSMPALLTENFFMDNQMECRNILMTKEGRNCIADAHINAIIRIEGRM